MRTIIANRCGLIDASNPCRCGRQVESSLELGVIKRDELPFVAQAKEPIEIDTIERAANQLDVALAMSEVYRTDPTFAAPREIWERVEAACPDLLR
jgi:hypothetical protein